MTSEEYINHCFNAGYNDALHGHTYRESFNEAMRTGSMDEYYERGWTEGRQDK